MPPPRAAPLRVAVVPAHASDEPRLARLLELYLHDFTGVLGGFPGDDGRFGYDPLALYWTDPGRRPYLIEAEGHLAGFALIQRGSAVTGAPEPMDVAEFFVVRGARRHGVGTKAAHALFARFPGAWEVRVLAQNEPALPFWRKVSAAIAARGVDEQRWRSADGRGWQVLRFHVEPHTGGSER